MTGYGFPNYRGGPMFYADTVGLGTILQRVREFEAQHGSRWKPAELLIKLAEAGHRFSAHIAE
jgi:3-hydroxyacyl-CoA dehydrogenase